MYLALCDLSEDESIMKAFPGTTLGIWSSTSVYKNCGIMIDVWMHVMMTFGKGLKSQLFRRAKGDSETREFF